MPPGAAGIDELVQIPHRALAVQDGAPSREVSEIPSAGHARDESPFVDPEAMAIGIAVETAKILHDAVAINKRVSRDVPGQRGSPGHLSLVVDAVAHAP